MAKQDVLPETPASGRAARTASLSALYKGGIAKAKTRSKVEVWHAAINQALALINCPPIAPLDTILAAALHHDQQRLSSGTSAAAAALPLLKNVAHHHNNAGCTNLVTNDVRFPQADQSSPGSSASSASYPFRQSDAGDMCKSSPASSFESDSTHVGVDIPYAKSQQRQQPQHQCVDMQIRQRGDIIDYASVFRYGNDDVDEVLDCFPVDDILANVDACPLASPLSMHTHGGFAIECRMPAPSPVFNSSTCASSPSSQLLNWLQQQQQQLQAGGTCLVSQQKDFLLATMSTNSVSPPPHPEHITPRTSSSKPMRYIATYASSQRRLSPFQHGAVMHSSITKAHITSAQPQKALWRCSDPSCNSQGGCELKDFCAACLDSLFGGVM